MKYFLINIALLLIISVFTVLLLIRPQRKKVSRIIRFTKGFSAELMLVNIMGILGFLIIYTARETSVIKSDSLLVMMVLLIVSVLVRARVSND